MYAQWEPFRVLPRGQFPLPPRSIHTLEGMGDRMRSAAFAELQARDAFHWASECFEDAPAELRTAWKELSIVEHRHLEWILKRMTELGIDPREREVSEHLWVALQACTTAREFAHLIADAEEKGRRAGIRFYETLKTKDPISSEIFRKIAEEEVDHVALAHRFYPRESVDIRPTPDPKT